MEQDSFCSIIDSVLVQWDEGARKSSPFTSCLCSYPHRWSGTLEVTERTELWIQVDQMSFLCNGR